ncbi:General transcription factor IIH subunit 2 [Linum perenne]
MVMDGGKRRLNGEAEEEENEEDVDDEGREAWEKQYTDERSWEALEEDESGLLHVDNTAIYHSKYRKRLRSLAPASGASRIQKGLIRFLYLVIDLSMAAGEMDFKPSRMAVIAKHVEAFIREFFDQNPLSQIGLVVIKDGVAQSLTELGGSPESHIKALISKLGCSGDSSLQNALELVHENLHKIPKYGHREVLVMYSALSTCDPGDIMATIQKCKEAKIRCSVIGLSAEMFVCKYLCQETGGSYMVALARSYHHLFPVEPFTEVSARQNELSRMSQKTCFGCRQSLLNPGNKAGPCVSCTKCKQYFCLDCDIYIHESLHNCPGCESLTNTKPVATATVE